MRNSFALRAVLLGTILLTIAVLASVGFLSRGNGKDESGAGTAREAGLGADAPANAGAGFLHTSGAQIVDSAGNPVRLTGITWWGGEIPETFTPQGTFKRPWADIVDQVASLGYNTLRLPYSDAMLDPTAQVGQVDLEKNPDLVDLRPLEVLDRIIAYAGTRGLRVVLAREYPDSYQENGLWYGENTTETTWIENWTMLAEHYSGNPVVIGADLSAGPRNEGSATGPCWGCGDTAIDWRLAAERAGAAVQEANPDWLIFVQGIDRVVGGVDQGWGGGNLSAAGDYPVRLPVPDKLVYAANDFGPSYGEQGWFTDPDFPSNLPAYWDEQWGYLTASGTAPVMVSKFGSTLTDPRDQAWMDALLDYLGEGPTGTSFAFYGLNPNDTGLGGLWTDDWESVDQNKQGLLAPYLEGPGEPITPE